MEKFGRNRAGYLRVIRYRIDVIKHCRHGVPTSPPPRSRRTGKRRKAIYGRIYEADSLFVPDLPTVARSDRDIAFEQFVVERGVMKPHRPLYRRNRLGCQDDISRKTRAF